MRRYTVQEIVELREKERNKGNSSSTNGRKPSDRDDVIQQIVDARAKARANTAVSTSSASVNQGSIPNKKTLVDNAFKEYYASLPSSDITPKTNAERLQALLDKSKDKASQDGSAVNGSGSVVAGSNTTAYGRMGQVGKNSPAYAALYGIDRMETAPAANEFKVTLDDIERQIAELEDQKKKVSDEADSEIEKIANQTHEKQTVFLTDYQRGLIDREAYLDELARLNIDLEDSKKNIESETKKKTNSIDEQIKLAQSEIISAYASLYDSEDFEEKSKYVSTEKTDDEKTWNEKIAIKDAPAFRDVIYDYVNKNEEAIKQYDSVDVSKTNRKYMSDDEIKIFNYLYSTQGADAAYEFVDFIEEGLNIRQRTTEEEEAAAFADEHEILASAASLGTNLLKPGVALAQAVDYAVNGEIDQNAGYNAPVYISAVYRKTVSDNIEKKWGPVGSFAYNTGMSMADFLTNTAVSGGNPYIASALMGTQTMADTVLSSLDRGLSSDQAMTLGLIAAGAEIITEKFSLDALFDKKGWAKNGLMYIVRNAFTEGTEEVGSGLINTFADILVSKDQSEWKQSIAYYMSEEGGGLSEEEAFNKAMQDQALSLGLDFLGGVVSGGVIGSGAAAVNAAVTAVSNKAEARSAKTKSEISVALDEVLGASEATQTTKAANFVDKISETVTKKTNAVNASVDYIRAKIKNIDAEITNLDNADVSDPKEADGIKERKAALVTERAALVTADEVIRTKRKEIEDLRRRKEKAEYAEVGKIDDDEDADGESAESGYNPIEDEDVRKAYESAAVSPETAAKELSRSYNGNLKETINLLTKEAANINASDLSSKVKREMLARLKSVDVALRKNNEAYVGEAVAQVKKKLAQYGVKNVYVDPGLGGMNNVKTNGYYDPKTKTVHLSPYLDDAALIWGASIHEFAHHNARHDMTLVNDGIKILESAIKADPELAKKFNRSSYMAAYAENVSDYLADAEGQAAVRSYIKDGLSPEDAAGKVADDYINEEMFAHYMQSLTEMNENDLLELVKENRSLFRRILDAIMDFIEMLKGKSMDTIKYEKAAKYLRTLLEYGTGVKTEAGKIDADGPITAEQVKNDTSLRYSIEVSADGDRFVKVSGNSLKGVADKDVPKVLAALVKSKFNTWVNVNGQSIRVDRDTVGEWVYSKYSKKLMTKEPLVYSDKMNTLENADELLKASKDYVNEALKHTRKDSIEGFARGTVDFKVEKNGYSAEIVVGIEHNGNALLYDIVNLQKKTITESSKAPLEETSLEHRLDDSVDNSIADSAEDVKGDLRFSVDVPVEEVGSLVAVHNLNEEKLKKTLALGGFPMPSIAIVRARDGFDKFGDISVVFGKATIDPSWNSKNKIYSADAWTPTFPRVEFKVSDAVVKRVRDKYYALADRVGYDAVRPLYRYVGEENFGEELNRDGGEAALLDRLRDDTDMMQVYLQDVGRDKVEPITREVREELSPERAEEARYIINALGENLVSEFSTPKGENPMRHRLNFVNSHREQIGEAYRDLLTELYGMSSEEAENAFQNAPDHELMRVVREAGDYAKNQGVTYRTEIDAEATKQAIREASSGYTEWVEDLFRGAEEKSGIRNQKGLYTPSGNRRGFDALHYETTLENVVLAMRESGERGHGSFGDGNIFGASAEQMASVDNVRKNAEQLQPLSDEEIDEIKAGFRDRFRELAERLPKNKNSMTAVDSAANMLVEAVVKYKTKRGIDNYLRRESEGWANYSSYIAEDLTELVRDIRSMPNSYFEAKPQRAVGLDEVKAVIVPDNISADVIDTLRDAGSPVISYKAGDKQSRVDALNSLEGVRFSKDVDASDFTYQALVSKPDITDPRSPVKPKIESVTKTQQFKRWFGDWQKHPNTASKVVNPDGTPKVMYHGTQAQFTVFDRKKAKASGLYGKGFYFTDSDAQSGVYGDSMAVYLNIRNPLSPNSSKVTDGQIRTFLEAVAENEDYSIENYGTYDVDEILGGIDARDAFAVIQDINATAIGDLVEAVELFNEVNGTKFDGIILPTETVAFYPEQIKSATDNIGTFDGSNADIRFSKDVENTSTDKIRPEMSDDERYEILKNRTIALTAETDYQRLVEFDGDLDSIETLKDTQKKKLLRKLGEQFGVVKRYENADIALEFNYSYENLKNSVQKQKKNYGDFAKMLSCFDDVVENAVGVEVHNRNGEYKTDSALKNMYVLVGAFRDGDSIVPVKLEVKEFNDSNINNTLYVSVALESIEKDRIETAPSLDENQNYAAPLSAISIADLFANVNTADGSFLKYIPDGFLNDTQRNAKVKYIADESERIERGGIRQSRDIPDTRTTEDKLREENAYLKRQFMARNGAEWAKAVSPEDLDKISRRIAKALPNVASAEVRQEIASVREILQRPITKEYSAAQRYRDAKAAAVIASKNLIDRARIISVSDEWLEIRDLKKKLRGTKVYVSDDVRSEFADWQSVRRELSGALSITTTDSGALGVDAFYAELSGEYPEYFSPDVTVPQQQMERIVEVARELKGIKQYRSESLWADAADTMDASVAKAENNAAVEAFANGILAEYDSAAVETLAAQFRKEKESNLWDSNSTRAMLSELERGILDAKREGEAAVKDAKMTAERYMQITRANAASFMKLYDEQLAEVRKETEEAQREASRATNRLIHRDERTELVKQRKELSKRLYRLYRDLVSPTHSNHIPEGLRVAVAKLLENFAGQNLDNGKTIDVSLLRKLSGKSVLELSENDANRVIGLFDRLASEISKNQTNKDVAVSEGFIKEISKSVENIRETFFEKRYLKGKEQQDEINYYAAFGKDYFAQLEIHYLTEVNKLLAKVRRYVDGANKVFVNGKTVFLSDMAKEVVSELDKRPQGKKYIPGKITYEYMTADTFFGMFGTVGDTIIKDYRKAQDLQMSREAEYSKYVKELFEGNKGYNTHDTGWGGDVFSITVEGKTFDVTRGQLMQCYITWKRPAGRRHMKNGGVYFTDKDGLEHRSRHVVFTDDSFASAMSVLPEKDKKMADAVAKFLSVRCASWGNEASMYLYGYQKFMDENYFPLISSRNSLPVKWDKMDEYSRLEYLGMTRSIKEDAKNALSMTNFFDVADAHVRNMAAYAAYAPLNSDVTRIFGMDRARTAVKETLGDKDGGWAYLQDFQKRVNQNKVMGAENLSSSRAMRILSNLYKRQAVALNLSTVMKQPLSYVRAWNSIEGKYLAMAFADKSVIPVVGSDAYKKLLSDMTEYSGLAKIKMLGYSDVGFGKSMRSVYDKDYTASGDRFKNKFLRGAAKGYDAIGEFGMWAAAKADEKTWVRLWKACELEVDATQKGLSADGRMRAVAEKFNQVIGETQVVDSILDTPPAVAKGDSLLNQVNAFMNEPIKTMNTIYKAFDDVRAKRSGAGKRLAKAMTVFAVSNLVLEPLVSALFTMLRDEEDEEGVFWEKLWNLMIGTPRAGEEWNLMDTLVSNSVSSIYGSIPIVEEICDIFFTTAQGYDVERMDASGITRLVNSVNTLLEYNPEKSQKTYANTWSDTVSSFAGAAGIPFNTVKRDIVAGIRLLMQWTDNYEVEWELNKLLYNINSSNARSQKNFLDILYKAKEAGDVEAYRYMREDLSNVITSSSKGLTSSYIIKKAEEKGKAFDFNSKIWEVELQANFNLPSFNTDMKVERLISSVYVKSKVGEEYDDNILPKTPGNSYSIKVKKENADGDMVDVSESVKFKNEADYIKFTEDVGYFSYMTLQCFAGSYLTTFSKLTNKQKAYAIKQAYAYAKNKYLKAYDKRYSISTQWQEELYDRNATVSKVAREILERAAKQ